MRRSLLAPAVVGRDAELGMLDAGLAEAAAGHGSTILITGEAGVGKSRLVREVVARCVERGAVALVGRAVDTATAMPLRPIAEALLAASRSGPLEMDADVAPFREALGRICPDLAGGPGSGGPASLLHIAEGFLRVARSRGRAGRGCVVLLDDLQWADPETLAIVEFLADNVRDEPVLVVGAARSDAQRSRSALAALMDRRAATTMRLRRLTSDQTVDLTRTCLGDAAVPAIVQRLVTDLSDGLPFFVEELLVGMEADGMLVRTTDGWVVDHRVHRRPPATLSESVRHRVASLPATAQELLRDAALLGRRIDAALLTTVTGLDEDVVGAALDAARDLALVDVDELGCSFRHSLTRDVLLAELAPTQRAARSVRALAGLRSAGRDFDPELIEVAAALAEATNERAVAVELLTEVGRRALLRGALTSAESAQRRALQRAAGTADELVVTELLVETLSLAGRADEAFPIGEVLLARIADEDPGGQRRTGVHLALARAAAARTDWRLATAHLDAARVLGGPGDVTAARLDVLGATVALGESRVREAVTLAAAAVELSGNTTDPDLCCEALLVHGRCLRPVDLDAAADSFERAREAARSAGLAHREARALTELGFLRAYQRSGDDVLLREARALAGACGAPETEAVAENALAAAAWWRCDVDAVLIHADAGLALARRFRMGQLIPALMIGAAAGHALRGDVPAMEAVLAAAEPLVRGAPMELIAVLAQARTTCALARDDLDVAAAYLAEAADVAHTEEPTAMVPMLCLHDLMRATDGAEPWPAAADLRRGYASSRELIAMLDAAEAVRLARESHRDAAGRKAEAALGALGASPFLHAVVARLVAPTAWTDGWGEPQRWLTAAATIFDVLGLRAPAASCRTILREIDTRSRRGELTARECDVLALIAEGLGNRAIAERLFLSPRTVEKHVERLLAKTGTANRAQLAVHAARRTTT